MFRPQGNIWRCDNIQNATLLVELMMLAHVFLRSFLQTVPKAWLIMCPFGSS